MNARPILLRITALILTGCCLVTSLAPRAQAAEHRGTAEIASTPELFRSPAFRETERMVGAGVEEATLLAYIQQASGTFNLGAEQVIQIGKLGASSAVIAAMMQHDRELALGRQAGALVSTPGAAREDGSAAATTSADSFFDALSPYGTWRNFEGYGWCWQPAVAAANSDWRPYGTAGRWLHTESGWYWASEYRWGGLVFQYGRWFLDGEWGWCWWPDTRWAAAWVTWRQGREYCGWAPLPPGSDAAAMGVTWQGAVVPWSFDFGLAWESYSFVAWRDFLNRRPERLALGRETSAWAGEHTTALNDLFLDGNQGVVNRGLPLQRVLETSGEAVTTTLIRQVPLTPGVGIEADRWANENGAWELHHPSSRAAANPGPSVAAQPVASPVPVPPWYPAYPREIPVVVLSAPAPAETVAAQPRSSAAPKRQPPEPPKPLYPVRPSQPVKLTDPILWPRPYSARTANLVVIELPPGP